MSRRWKPGIFGVLLLALAACRESTSAPVAPRETAPVAVYSPFVVQVRGDVPYQQISFKQVGEPIASVDPAVLFEAIAESVALELSVGAGGLISETIYDPRVTDPAVHKACGAAQIYVDFWQESDGFGYSLWSGCGEESRFALDQVGAPEQESVADQVTPLARAIARRLSRATETRCFQRTC